MAAPAAAGGEGAPAKEEAKRDVRRRPQAAGDKKIQVIKEVRSLTSLGLKEAKDLVDGGAQGGARKGVQGGRREGKGRLETAGASVELK